MKRSFFLFLLTILFIAGAFAWTILDRPDHAFAQAGPLTGQVQTATGSTFTYQGRLLDNGQPVDGMLCQFLFTLWDAESGGNDLITRDATAVLHQGYFSVEMDFGQDAFTGEPRWISVGVRCPAYQGQWQALQGRIAVNPTPYAMVAETLPPGAVIVDKTGSNVGLYAQSGGDWTPPLEIALKTSGLWGDSQADDGVIGTSQWGNALYGYSEFGKALYADGDAHVEGELTWKTKTSAISIAPAAFQPEHDARYSNLGHSLMNNDSSEIYWIAPVQLPHKARVTKITVCWQDGHDGVAQVTLKRRKLVGGELDERDNLATVRSRGAVNTIIIGCYPEDVTQYADVDNTQYAYYLNLTLPRHGGNDAPMEFYGVIIEYEITEPY